MDRVYRKVALLVLPIVAALAAACSPVESFLDTQASLHDKPLVWMHAAHKGNGSELEVGYRLPPPPEGRVYVVWALTRDHGRTQKLAVLTEGSPDGRVSGTTGFRVEGVMISVEDSPNVTRIGEERGLVDVGMR